MVAVIFSQLGLGFICFSEYQAWGMGEVVGECVCIRTMFSSLPLKNLWHRESHQFSSVAQSCPWTAAHQASLSITNSWSLPRLTSIELVMPSNHLILCRPLLLPPSIFPSISVFSNESALPIRWPKYWSFTFSISPSNEQSGLISFRMD